MRSCSSPCAIWTCWRARRRPSCASSRLQKLSLNYSLRCGAWPRSTTTMSSSTPWRRSATASTRTWPRILIQDRPSPARRRGGSRARTRPGPRAPRRRAAAGGPRSDGTRAARGRRPAPRRRRRPRRRRGATATGGGGSRPRPRTGGPSRVWIGCASRTRHQIRTRRRQGNVGVLANLRISNTF